MKEVVIVSAVRTPVGSFGGVFKDVPAVDLGVVAVKEAIRQAGIKPEDVNEVYMGCILQSGLGQGVARQISVKAGIPVEVGLLEDEVRAFLGPYLHSGGSEPPLGW